jgi:hypothetical protein
MSRIISLLVVLSVVLSVRPLRAQEKADSARTPRARMDTARFKMTKDPWLAFGLSAALPGAGQIYLGQWYKAPFILAGIGGCITAALVQNSRYKYTADSVTNQLARGDTYNALRYTSVREFYRDDRDRWYIYAGLVYVANLLDAYIAANLYDFDVDDPAGAHPYLSAPASSAEPWRLGVRVGF